MALATDQVLKMNFENTALFASLWLEVKNEYSELAEFTLNPLLPFQWTHLSEAGCSARSIMTTKQRKV